jgi:hypothetical protein
MLNVEILTYDELPESINKTLLSNNGIGMENASYLVVWHNENVIVCESDAMEPEDCRMSRDLRWLRHAIADAYQKGLQDAKLTKP